MTESNDDNLDPIVVLIAQARRQLPLLYPPEHYPSLDFDAPEWDLRPITSPHGTKSSTLRFYPLASDSSYPQRFAELLKAVVILSRLNSLDAYNSVNAYRYLWEAVSRRVQGAPFHWSTLAAEDLDAAEQILIDKGFKPTTIYAYACKFLSLAKWLDSNKICEGLEWRPRTRDPKIERMRTNAGRDKWLDRLPTRRAIEGLGEIYRVAKDTKDRLLICSVGLLLVGGFRISELITLPADCWVEDFHRGRKRYGLRFWNRKTRGGVWQWAVRWLSPMGAELARTLIDEIEEITRSARAQALVLESDPTQVTIPGKDGQDELTTREVAELLGATPDGIKCMLRLKKLNFTRRRSPVGRGRTNLIPKTEVEAALLRNRGPLYTLDLGNGKRQSLSETLLIVHQGMFANKALALRPLLVQQLTYQHFQLFLTGHTDDSPSVFKRFGIKEPAAANEEGRYTKMKTMMFRHWLNTIANKASMSAFQITMWMQRTNAAHTLLYLHSASDIADLTREGIREGQLVGRRVDEFNALPEESRENYLETISAAHQTSTGKCTADFNVSNCGMSKACELGCVFYLHTVGDDQERKNLAAKKERFFLALQRIEEAEHTGRIVQPRQRVLYESWIVEINRLLATSKNS